MLLCLRLALCPALLLEASLLLGLLPLLTLQALLLPRLQLPLPRRPVLLAHHTLRLVTGLGGAESVVSRDDSGSGGSGQHRTARDRTGGRRSDSRPLYLRPE